MESDKKLFFREADPYATLELALNLSLERGPQKLPEALYYARGSNL
jgi:hypothetical protein